MTVLLRRFRVPFHRTEEELPRLLARQLRLQPGAIQELQIVRKSLDSREGRKPRYEYCLALRLDPTLEARLLRRRRPRFEVYRPSRREAVTPIRRTPERRPVVVGTGPAGLFAAYRLTQAGSSPIILERGPNVRDRSLRWHAFLSGGPFDEEANLLFGEGGAGTYSDGKLYTRVSDPRVREVLEVLADCGAPSEILYDAKPHVGSNRLPAVVRNLRRHLIEKGVEIRFETRMVDLRIEGGEDDRRLTGVDIQPGEALATDTLFLAPGHSARDTFRLLARCGLTFEPKPFQMGVRIEHPQEVIDRIQYRESAGHPALPPAEYHWVEKGGSADVFSFCMCPGGEMLPATEHAGTICLNGASRYRRRSPYATSGFVVTVEPEQFGEPGVFGGLGLQERVESGAAAAAGIPFAAPAVRLMDFLREVVSDTLPPSSYPLPLVPARFDFLPPHVLAPIREAFHRLGSRYAGFLHEDAIVAAPESRSSSPVRMVRDRVTRESPSIRGVIPMGEGAGYAGGIVSAAIDGLRCAEAWLTRVSG